ncbi:MAG: rhodanese-like domain-containing protein [Mycobacterium sp.]
MTRTLTGPQLRALLTDPNAEIALLDVRAPQVRSAGHIAVSSGVPLHDLEQRVPVAVPLRSTPIVLASEPDLDYRAADILARLGYTDVSVLADGLAGWTAAGGRLYTGTNVRSKTLGEWIEKHYGTATVDSETVAAWRAAGEDVVVLDSRPHGEYVHHHIPGGYDTGGGAELAYRGLQLVTKPTTKIVINCAGRTRGIVGAQSVINTGIANPVFSLHNGTPAWGWAGQQIEAGPGNPLDAPAAVPDDLRQWAGRTLADAGVDVLPLAELAGLQADQSRTTYVIDVRTPQEYAAGTAPGARNVQGGQLVQGSDEHIAVRGARIVLVDNDELVRAASTVQWLRYLHDGPVAVVALAPGVTAAPELPAVALPEVPVITGTELAQAIESGTAPVIFDLRNSRDYAAGHLPGSIHARREHLTRAATGAARIVLVGDNPPTPQQGGHDLQTGSLGGYHPHFAARDLIEQGHDVAVLEHGPDSVGIALTAENPSYTGDIADQVGPPPFGPARDAWYREYFEWEYSLLPESEGDPDFDFESKTS